MTLLFHKRVKKELKRLPKNKRKQFYENLRLFAMNPHHPLLGTHALHGKYVGYMSMNVDGDLRAVYEVLSGDVVRFVAIGTHHQLFGS